MPNWITDIPIPVNQPVARLETLLMYLEWYRDCVETHGEVLGMIKQVEGDIKDYA